MERKQTNQTLPNTSDYAHQISLNSTEIFDGMRREGTILVLGLGGFGCNVIDHIYRDVAEKNREILRFMVINTDFHEMEAKVSPDVHRMQIGKSRTDGRGQGAGGDPRVGEELMRGDAEEFKDYILGLKNDSNQPLNFVIMIAGLGKGTGSGSIRVIAELFAREEVDVDSLAVVVTPELSNGPLQKDNAKETLNIIQPLLKSICVYDNNGLEEAYPNQGLEKNDEIMVGTIANVVKSFLKVSSVVWRRNLDPNDAKNSLGMNRSNGSFQSNRVVIATATGPDEEAMMEGQKPENYDEMNIIQKTLYQAINKSIIFGADLKGATRALLAISYLKDNAVCQEEMTDIKDTLRQETQNLELNIDVSYGTQGHVPDGKCDVLIMFAQFADNHSLADQLEEKYQAYLEKQRGKFSFSSQQNEKRKAVQPQKGSISRNASNAATSETLFSEQLPAIKVLPASVVQDNIPLRSAAQASEPETNIIDPDAIPFTINPSGGYKIKGDDKDWE